MFDFLSGKNTKINEVDACAVTDNTAVDAVCMANYYIFSECNHPGYTLKSIVHIQDNDYKITISDGYSFIISQQFAENIIIGIADEFNRHYREDVCHLYENLDKVRN